MALLGAGGSAALLGDVAQVVVVVLFCTTTTGHCSNKKPWIPKSNSANTTTRTMSRIPIVASLLLLMYQKSKQKRCFIHLNEGSRVVDGNEQRPWALLIPTIWCWLVFGFALR
jgi:hypothetical protein